MATVSSRFGYLLEPIRDLTKNWEVDVASQLDDYISEIAEIRISFDGGMTTLNFAEAALLIQGTACVYSRKVEYLHALVYQTLDLISSKRKLAHVSSVDAQGRDTDVSVREEQPLLVLDDLPVSNVDMGEQNANSSIMAPPTSVPRTPLSLIPLRGSERVKSTPLLSRTGELLGTNVDFKMNTGYVHSTGALILEPLGRQLVISVTKKGSSIPINITSSTPAADIASMLATPAPRDDDMDTMDIAPPPPPLDDSGVYEDLVGGSPQLVRPAHDTTGHPPLTLRKKKRVRVREEKKFIDPLQPLDPHLQNNRDIKPPKKGVTHRVPVSLKDLQSNVKSSNSVGQKRPLTKRPVKQDSLATFLQRSLYSCSSLFPKSYLKAPSSTEFEGLYWEEQKRHKEQRKADNKKMRMFLKPESGVVAADDVMATEQDTYHPLGPEDVSDEEEDGGRETALPAVAVDDEQQFQAAFERFHHVSGSFQGVEPMALEEGSSTGSLSGTPRKDQKCNYEDMVREYVETTSVAAAAYVHETELTLRVSEWEERIKPILNNEESHPVFDIHHCGTNVIDTFKVESKLKFHEVTRGKQLFEISRLFAATLQLTNDRNVNILRDGSMDAMGLDLLSTSRKFEKVSNYKAPSQ